MKKHILFLIALSAFASPVVAQTEQGRFSGLHGGVLAGYDYFSDGYISADGMMGSLTLGYDHQTGPVVLGLEGHIDLNSAQTYYAKADWGYGVSARVGVNLNDVGMPYIRFGYQETRYSGFGYWDTETAPFIGGGGDIALSSKLALRIEGNYYWYGEGTYNSQAKIGAIFKF